MSDLKHVINAAVAAGNVVLALRDTNFSRHSKESNRDVVTEADLISERLIIDSLTQNLVSFSYLSEELNILVGDQSNFWAIDPIDGTANFVAGSSNFCVSLGHVSGTALNTGVVFAPASNDLYYASIGEGAYKNQNKLSVKSCILSDSLITFSLPGKADLDGDKNIYQLLSQLNNLSSGIIRLGSAALHLVHHADGIYGGCVGFDAPIWDIAGGLAICNIAGSSYRLFPTDNEYRFHYVCAPTDLLDQLCVLMKPCL